MFTVYELPADLFQRAAALFAVFDSAPFDEMFINPALDGRQAGRVFVEQPEQPTSALLCRTYEFYIAGEPTAALRAFIHDSPAEPGTFQTFHGFAPLNRSWIDALNADFGAALMNLERCNFSWANAPLRDWRAQLPEGMAVVPITAALAERIDRELNEHIGFTWSGYDQFAAHGYGVCLMRADELLSAAFTDGADEHSASVGVVTAEAVRRQGLAQLTCSAFIENTLGRGLLPVWECEVRNSGSKHLAESLGFVERNRFYQLSVADPPYGKLNLSHKRWQAEAVDAGVVRWRKGAFTPDPIRMKLRNP